MINITLQSVIALALALLFGAAGWHKLRSGSRFQAQLAAYQLLPAKGVVASAWLLAGIELLLVPILLLPITRTHSGWIAATLLLLYALAISINLLRGRSDIDCGCGDRPQRLSIWLVLRNLLLAAGALLLTLSAPLTSFAWSDLLIAVPAFLALCFVYQVAEQLLSNASLLQGSHNDLS